MLIITVMIIPTALLSAQSPGERISYHPSLKVQVVPDLIFARYGGRSLRLDLYLPVDRNKAVPGAGAKRTVARFLNATPAQNPKLWARASPVHYARAGGPPVLLMHSNTDEAVLPEQSSRFAKAYRQAGGEVELVFIEHAHHAFWNYKPWFENAMERAAAFFLRLID